MGVQVTYLNLFLSPSAVPGDAQSAIVYLQENGEGKSLEDILKMGQWTGNVIGSGK